MIIASRRPIIYVTKPVHYFTEARLISSKKGKTLILWNDYTYCFACKCKSGIRWRCSTHHRHGCRAFLRTDDNHVIIHYSVIHSH